VISPHELPTHQVTITGGQAIGRTLVAIDGHEIRTCTKATLNLTADTAPVLELSLLVLNDLDTGLPALVVLDGPARAALRAMGWTPPPGETEEE